MEVRVVGPLEAIRDGRAVALAPKERIVLARLALAGGGTVSDDALRDAVWPRGAPSTATKTLAGYVHRLRQAIGAEAVVRRPTGYRLDLDLAALDLVSVDEDVAAGRRAVVAGDRSGALAAYRRALDRFRGMPFEELDDVEEAVVERARLREVRNCVDEELHEILLADGVVSDLIPELEACVAREPTRERAWGQLMVALARSGRQADALDAYARARRSLALELGIEPSPQLQALHRQLLGQDAQIFVVEPIGTRTVSRSVNVPLDRLVGRDEDVHRITDALGTHRLITLVGSGGAGKTRLAKHIVEATDDASVVELAPVGASGVDGALLRGLGLDEHPGRSAVEVVARWSHERPVLILIDNCEHVITAAAAIATELLEACPRMRVMTTSRERLRVRGEVVIEVTPLATPDTDADIDSSPAVQLFVERSMDAGVALDLTHPEERAAVAAVCRSLDGLPLALELGAARLRTRSVVELRQDLDSLDLPVGRRDLPARQQSLDALVAWSEALLDTPTRVALRRLAVFPADFDAEAARAVLAGDLIDPGAELTALAALVEASLVTVERQPGAPHRYRLLETVRRHARRQLTASGERAATMGSLVGWTERVVATIEPQIRTPRQDGALAVAASERPSITAACDHAMIVGDVRRALRIAATVPIGRLAERRGLLQRLLAADPDAPPGLRARAWSTLANLASDVGDGAGQAMAATEALVAAREAGDVAQMAWARYFLVLGNWAVGRRDGLSELIDEATAGFERIGSAHGVASMLWIGSQVERDAATADRAVAAFRGVGIDSGLAHALEGRALLALARGDHDTVRADLAEATTIVSAIGNSGCTAHCVESVAAFAADRRRYAEARLLVDVAAVMRELSGHGMRVWEHEGHDRVLAALAERAVEPVAVPAGLDVAGAAAIALDVLADRAD